MTKWRLQTLEFFCMFDNMHKKKSTFHHYGKGFLKKDGSMKKPTKTETIDNPLYIKADRPVWCKKKFPGRKERTPEFKCLCEGGEQCPFLAYTDVDKIDKEVLDAAFNIKEVTCWDDDKMKVNTKCCRKFIKHMNMFSIHKEFVDKLKGNKK